jgi:hypothetical protein
MTIAEALTKIDALKPNQYTAAVKTGWLSELDLLVKRKIVDTHEGYETIPDLGLDEAGVQIPFTGYTDETVTTTVLLVPEPFSEIYVLWLAQKIDFYNNEIARFNNSAMMYNTAWQEYATWYNSTVMPRQDHYISV